MWIEACAVSSKSKPGLERLLDETNQACLIPGGAAFQVPVHCKEWKGALWGKRSARESIRAGFGTGGGQPNQRILCLVAGI